MYTNSSKEPKFSIIKPACILAEDWPVLRVGLILAKAPKGVQPVLVQNVNKFLARSGPCQR